MTKPKSATVPSVPRKCSIITCDNEYYHNGNEHPICVYHRKRWYLFKSRGFTYEKFIELQTTEFCDCCGQELRTRNMDHDHSHCPSGSWCSVCVRGVLCSRCNGLLAAIDDPVFMRQAEKYLKLYSSREPGELR